MNICILLTIFITFNNLSIILCKKSDSPKNSPKTKPLSSGSKKSRKDLGNKLSSTHGEEWRYGQNWRTLRDNDAICYGSQQSPIRLSTSMAVRNTSLHFTLQNYNRDIRMATIENTGHTVQIEFEDRFKATLYGSATNYQKYIFSQLHFHWGSHDGIGSEHTVDGYRGPMEVHMVHYNSKYGTLKNAAIQPDGLMVLGVLFRISSRNNRLISSVIKLVRNVPNYEDKSRLLGTFRLNDLLPDRKRPFFMYKGSLTTPPCYESVQWLVFENTRPIGDTQERVFRRIRSEWVNSQTGKIKILSNNFRPVQAINERQITISS